MKRIALLLMLCASSIQAETAALNWCAEWFEGYEYGFHLKCPECDHVLPATCPPVEKEGREGFMRGLLDGTADGKEAANNEPLN